VSADVPPVVRLGNDLARNFAALGPEAAAEQVAAHIRRFWEPRMRRELLEHVAGGDPRVEPLLARAAEQLGDGDADGSAPRAPGRA
jgi:formate dehydrogenase subunit delta